MSSFVLDIRTYVMQSWSTRVCVCEVMQCEQISQFIMTGHNANAQSVVWEELIVTSKLLSSTYFKIKGNCSLKAARLLLLLLEL